MLHRLRFRRPWNDLEIKVIFHISIRNISIRNFSSEIFLIQELLLLNFQKVIINLVSLEKKVGTLNIKKSDDLTSFL